MPKLTKVLVPTMIALGMLASPAAAQQNALPADIAGVPEFIKGGTWKKIDLAGLSPLEHCRALLVLNHVLDELRATAIAQADLMSTYLHQNGLGAEFANQGVTPPPGSLTYEDGLKIAVGLMRGPLAGTTAATALADVPPNGLQAYEHLYESTCELRWNEVTAAGRQVRCMGRFLKTTNRLADFQQWAPQEVERRQQAYDADMANRRKSATEREAKERAQEQQAMAKREQEQQQAQAAAQAQAASTQMQQALVAAQQQAAQAAANSGDGGDDDCWGLNYYGAVSNLERAAWVRDPAQLGAARAATEARVSDWHGAGGGARR